MEQNKLPKNIRQIGEKEDWIRVYMEDYVHTYIQRLRDLQEGGISGGILLGKKQRINGVMHLFIRGAVVAPDPFWRDPAQTPGQLRTESSVYFPEQEICGFFVSSRQNRSSEVDLVRIFETHFSSEYQILFNVRDQEEEAFSWSGHSLVRLAGYYIYYEKNEEMQSYIIRQESLRVLEKQSGSGGNRQEEKETGRSGPTLAGGPGIKTGAGQTEQVKGRRQAAGKKTAARRKMQKGDLIVRIVSVAGIFILAFLLFSDQIKFSKNDDSSANSSGLLSSILDESSAVPAGADSSYIETGAGTESGGIGESGTGNNDGSSDGTDSESSDESGGGKENGDGSADGTAAGLSGESGGSAEEAGNTAEAANGTSVQESAGQTEESSSSGSAVSATGYVFPMRYLVKKGDSLYAICEKYYGDTEMVDAVCLENDISDPAQLKYGVVLTLPAR